MPTFEFNETKTFEENWISFMGALQEVDPILTEILRDNEQELAAIVRDGERDSTARTNLNSKISIALDALTSVDDAQDGE